MAPNGVRVPEGVVTVSVRGDVVSWRVAADDVVVDAVSVASASRSVKAGWLALLMVSLARGGMEGGAVHADSGYPIGVLPIEPTGVVGLGSEAAAGAASSSGAAVAARTMGVGAGAPAVTAAAPASSDG